MRTISTPSLPLLTLSSLLGLTLVACGGDDYGSYDESGSNEAASGASASESASSDSTSGDGSDTGWDPTDGASSAGGTSGGDWETGGFDTDGESGDDSTTTTDGDTTDTTDGEEEEFCDDETEVTLFLSPDDSNSMSSPVQVRAAANDGWNKLWGVPIRMWEFFNYYTFEYPEAKAGEVVITTELYRLEDQPAGEYLMQIGISSETVTNEQRAAMNILLVLDESGSMSGLPMEMQIESCLAIAASLKEGDVVSMVGWDTSNAIKLAGYAVSGPSDATLVDKCKGLTPRGGTDLNGGLIAGYDLAKASYDVTRINRVVLVSDGGANAGVTDIDLIASNAGGNNEDGIYIVGVGVGHASSYNDQLMDTVTDIGKGASVFIPDAEEAWKIFHTDFVNTMSVAVRDVQIRLDMPPGFEIVKFSGEEYSADPTEIEPQHLAPNDAMVFYQTIATCAPELIEDDTPITVTATYKDPITFEQRETQMTITFGELLGIESPMVRKGSALYAYVEALQAIRNNDPAEDIAAAKAEALARITAAQALLPGDDELAEFATILEAF